MCKSPTFYLGLLLVAVTGRRIRAFEEKAGTGLREAGSETLLNGAALNIGNEQ